ncbi:hypothetical protein B0O80DRAFT_138044 [Mortierella sp. GBAus27b]|nr:hypothetical protein B0O80DRAFT_138044 [Mortierella sp. GBAus27b]
MLSIYVAILMDEDDVHYKMKGCINMEELEIGLTDDIGIDSGYMATAWDSTFTASIRDKPRLHTVRVTGPTKTFLRALFTCCTQRKVLHIRDFVFQDAVIAELFYDVCLRLQELKVEDTVLYNHGFLNISCNIKTLWVGYKKREWQNNQRECQCGVSSVWWLRSVRDDVSY